MYDAEVYQAEAHEHDDDPITYGETMNDIEAKFWKKAMNNEMNSMKSNSI